MRTRQLIGIWLVALSAVAGAGPLEDAQSARQRGDFKEAFRILKPLADRGDVRAMGEVGNAYGLGRGVDKDLKKAGVFWAKAAEKHFAPAMFNIATLYWTGQGSVARDEGVAAAWYKQAAEHGHGQSMLTLSTLYAGGRGLPPSQELAVAWATLAIAHAGNEKQADAARTMLRELSRSMSQADLAPIEKIVQKLGKQIDANVALYLKEQAG